MIYQRGKVWWYEFEFLGQRIRESTHSKNRKLAEKAERVRRQQLESGINQVKEAKRPITFILAAKQWLQTNPHWSARTLEINLLKVKSVEAHFGKALLVDITGDDVSRYQTKRLSEGASPRTVNMEVGVLRQILRKARLWANIQPDVKMLREPSEIGRALTPDEESRVLAACRASGSRSLYPAVLVSAHTGVRNKELRLLRWRQVDLIERTLTVGESKTEGGTGRMVPLNDAATQCLKEWRAQFPDAKPSDYVFPSERYGLDGEKGYLHGKRTSYNVRPEVPIGSWKVAWTAARKKAGVDCRWHDLRHTFVSKLGENGVSDTTITAVAGWMSRKMMERYSHTSNDAKRRAVALLDGISEPEGAGSPQNPPHSQETAPALIQ